MIFCVESWAAWLILIYAIGLVHTAMVPWRAFIDGRISKRPHVSSVWVFALLWPFVFLYFVSYAIAGIVGGIREAKNK